jgi:hypothetical protein
MHLKYTLLILILLMTRNSVANELETCATTIGELKVMLTDQTFPLIWEETTMNDEKPLMVSILEINGNLVLEFTKTREGLWAKSVVTFCKAGNDLEAHFTREQIHTGPAANWVLRYVLGKGGKFTLTKLGAEQLRIATNGWSGNFSPSTK